VLSADGHPAAIFVSANRARSSSIDSLDDETIANLFPPSMRELAELAAVDEVNDMLAHLEALEYFEGGPDADPLFLRHPRRFECRRREPPSKPRDARGLPPPPYREGTLRPLEEEDVVVFHRTRATETHAPRAPRWGKAAPRGRPAKQNGRGGLLPGHRSNH
jgi:hypothetical protein